MPKKFFFVSVAVFLLALAFHLGATTAQGQSGGTGWFLAGSDHGADPYIVTASGDRIRYVPGYGWLNDMGNVFGGASAGRTVVDLVPGMLRTSSGEVWYGTMGGTWTNAGAPPVGPTTARSESFGALKARYR